ncbi:hypothetical protein HU200_024669 [Digitaria exilis]|uniref:NAC domain-containing protein n=1 Tax=Digitaria exilis TaxID=1010633 RepID=A0A835C2M4_9POAL|nr:hypothetical protein HU200_024669 [Digitaria exilis]
MPPLAAETPQPGDSASTPADDRLLAFLRQKLAGEVLPAAAAAHFHDADIYAADPATLTLGFDPSPAKKCEEGGSWFFFTHVKPKSRNDSRKSRMVGGGAGTWHSERAPRAVFDGEGSCVGHSQYFSYKRKTGKNCSERTDWYMVEFTEGQEGDHERIHGGEPMLVLCKIYRAHSSSRSSASSRSGRKRKPTDEHVHVDQSSAPVKAKRRLFAPAPPKAAASQEQVSSRVIMAGSQGETSKSELEVCNGNIGGASDDLILVAKQVAALNKTSTATPSQNKLSTASPSLVMSESDFLRFWPEPEASQVDGTSDYLKFSWETEELQKAITTAPSLLMLEPEASMLQGVPGMFDLGAEALHKTCSSPPSVSMFEPEVSAVQGERTAFDWGTEALQMINGISDYLKFSSETEALQKPSITPASLSMFEPEVSALKGETAMFDFGTKPLRKIDDTSDDLKLSSETETLQKISTTPPSLSMFEPEASALQDETSTFDWDIQMPAGCTPPASAHCYGMTDPMGDGFSPPFSLGEQDAWSWTSNGNSTTPPFCRDRAWFVGGPPTYDVWGC